MEKFTVEEFQEDFDNLLERVESGESFIITDEEKEVVIMPAEDYEYIVDTVDGIVDEEVIRIHTDHEEGCWFKATHSCYMLLQGNFMGGYFNGKRGSL